MEKKMKERRVYTKEFKTEAIALVEKGEKPVRQIVGDLGVNETGGYSGQRRRQTTSCRPSPDTDGRGTKNWSGCGKK
jgi:transposase-like protein